MENSIAGNPTKSFFITMITRDISIEDAILDLLDNSIDGANRLNPDDFSGLFIDVNINENEFSIKDNCGGFSLETAKKYAFRFGRPDEAPPTEGSIGRFGVGMKRALFKIGRSFEVETKSENDHFQIDVEVEEWKKRKKNIILEDGQKIEEDDWSFNYKEITEDSSDLEENGTYIKVHKLNEDVAGIFDNEFLDELQSTIERLLNFSLEKGITIRLNGKELGKKDIVLFNDSSKPYYYEGESKGVKFRVVAGLSFIGEPKKSGWYIYCNDRLVMEADTSPITGWGTGGIPRFHVDYVMFKGVVFFDSKETISLPLTTTKKGIDATSEVYKKALFFMREAMTNVLGFLKKVRKLGNEANEYRTLLGEQEDKIIVTAIKESRIDVPRKFQEPEIDNDKIAVKTNETRISYRVERARADQARIQSETKSYKELGEYTFEYYSKMENLEDE